MNKFLAIMALLCVTSSAMAAKAKTAEPTLEEKKACRDTTTIVDMMADARDRGTTLKEARDQRIGFSEMKQMLDSMGKQATEAEISEATDSMIDVVFIRRATYPRTMLVSDYFNMCIREIVKPGK
jgi:soluble cytochrome b562